MFIVAGEKPSPRPPAPGPRPPAPGPRPPAPGPYDTPEFAINFVREAKSC